MSPGSMSAPFRWRPACARSGSSSPRRRRPGDPDPVLKEATARFEATGAGPDALHVFNWQFVRDRLCSSPRFDNFPGFIFLFDPSQRSEFPRYRFPRAAVSPYGLVTNQFGWRGAALEFQKPARTIRLAFVGASTTVNKSCLSVLVSGSSSVSGSICGSASATPV